ncbi:MAG: TetR/AcrR family transcriptional regulator [Syntrophomonadaceae bacterium]|jgi:AcrR family transcriptional regulator
MKRSKRDIILDAAVTVFSAKGYHNTRMEEIAVNAGIGKGTIYEYFDSKLQLFQEILERSLGKYYESLDINRQEPIGFAERMYILFQSHIKFCYENKELTRIVFWDMENFDEELKDWGYKIRKEKEERLINIVTESIRQGELRDVNPQLLTQMIMGSLGSLWVPITIEGWNINPGTLAQQLIDMLMNGIKA